MKANSDKEHERFKNLDFSNAKPVADTPHLHRLQAAAGTKSRITMRVDSDVLAVFRARAEMSGANYQTLMNDALKQFAQGLTLADVLDISVREAVDACLARHAPSRRETIT
jgi:uncharacterized protein (DUF4415 family)